MRVCINTLTDRIIEAQSDAVAGTLIANAVSSGLAPENVQELEMAPDELAQALEIQDPPAITVTPRQFRLALNATGMRQAIEDYVAAGSQDVKDTWQFATVIERSSPIIAAGAAQLQLTEGQIDDLFALAATL